MARYIVLGTLASNPFAGMAWMHMHIALGLQKLGHDVYYFELTKSWPFDVVRNQRVDDPLSAVAYLRNVAERFGLQHRWAYRATYANNEWFGIGEQRANEVMRSADAVFNVAGATYPDGEFDRSRLIYFETDPVVHEIAYAQGDERIRNLVDQHYASVTYGENIGTSHCPVPPFPNLRAKVRQPVVLDLWPVQPPGRQEFTTLGNWKQSGMDFEFQGDTYFWSKDREFLKIVELPRRSRQSLEFATNLTNGAKLSTKRMRAQGVPKETSLLLEANGWKLADGRALSMDPWKYRDYILDSRGEFTVARDLNVRLRSGWFSERSACYLAAGRPVVTQDTGFATVLPTGEGLFAFSGMDDILAAFDAINSDYDRHSRAARAIADEYFRAETVMRRVLADLSL
jgi:hypothetical protein